MGEIRSREELGLMKDIATMFVRSNYFGLEDAAQALVKMWAGRALGLDEYTAISEINIIKGRPEMSARLAAARVKSSGKYDYRIVEHTNEACEIVFREWANELQRWVDLGKSRFTIDDAKIAGLDRQANYRAYARNMLFSRAMTNGVGWYCPDVMGGAAVYSPGEILKEDFKEIEAKATSDQDAYRGYAENMRKRVVPTLKDLGNVEVVAEYDGAGKVRSMKLEDEKTPHEDMTDTLADGPHYQEPDLPAEEDDLDGLPTDPEARKLAMMKYIKAQAGKPYYAPTLSVMGVEQPGKLGPEKMYQVWERLHQEEEMDEGRAG